MTEKATKTVRCAIYTRVSTDHRLEQDFNSLDAQYESSQAYIKSQAHAGWIQVRSKYDDGGFSGGHTDRPALQKLLNDVRARQIDIIIVYKVDRLTRSLSDFAKLVDLFDKHGVSFVSVTQQFNTTTSMGRLTLNVLLSFAQFEREVTSERIRDKIAASKRKGLWVGGMTPLGYDAKDKKISINTTEAATVRAIFELYLKAGSLNLLMPLLRQERIFTKSRTLKSGKTIGGIPFTRGPLAHLLRNPFYIGQVRFKGEILKGEQSPILDRKLFEAVQAKLDQQLNSHHVKRANSEALLMGKLFDDYGNRMSPTHTRKDGVRYRYYLSCVLVQGKQKQAGKIARVPAVEIEELLVSSLREKFHIPVEVAAKSLVNDYVERIDLREDKLIITCIRKLAVRDSKQKKSPKFIEIPWKKTLLPRRRQILLPASGEGETIAPIRSENRKLLVTSIAQGRRWLKELITDPSITAEAIANREKCSVRKVNMTISLAFLAPNLVKAAIAGTLPAGLGVSRLSDLPPEWSRQHAVLGLTPTTSLPSC